MLHSLSFWGSERNKDTKVLRGDSAGFAFLQRLRPLVGLVWFLKNNLICLPPSPKSQIQPKAWRLLDEHLQTALYPCPSGVVLNWFLGFATGEALEIKF